MKKAKVKITVGANTYKSIRITNMPEKWFCVARLPHNSQKTCEPRMHTRESRNSIAIRLDDLLVLMEG